MGVSPSGNTPLNTDPIRLSDAVQVSAGVSEELLLESVMR